MCSAPWKLTSRDFWTSRNERKPLSKQKCVLRQCCRVSRKWWMLELSNHYQCVQHPWKLTSKDFWTSRNETKPLSMQKCVLRKCCGVAQKWWMLQLSKLCHCVQHPWTLTSRDFWSSRNERKTLSKQKCVLRNAVGYLRTCQSFQTFTIVFSTPENLNVGISGDLGMRENHFLTKNVFWQNAVGYLRNGKC